MMDLRLVNPFIASTIDIIKQMTGVELVESGKPYSEVGDICSAGVTSVINFSGKIKGRFMIDMPPDLAFKMVENLTGEACANLKDRMFLAAISEMNNIIAGDANTLLNNQYALGLRLAPPIVFTGRQIIVSTFRMNSASVKCKAELGELRINIGFQGGVG